MCQRGSTKGATAEHHPEPIPEHLNLQYHHGYSLRSVSGRFSSVAFGE